MIPSWPRCTKTGEVHFCLLDTNRFHVKPKNERFTAADSSCRQNHKCENLTSFGRLRQKNAPKSVPHVQHQSNSTNQITDLWCCRGCCCRHFLYSLLQLYGPRERMTKNSHFFFLIPKPLLPISF